MNKIPYQYIQNDLLTNPQKYQMSSYDGPDFLTSYQFSRIKIIDELEKSKRKMYAGSIGYFSANKNFDTCIALRTALIKNNKFYIQSGAGIVADSIPEKEYSETVNKAKALINSLN